GVPEACRRRRPGRRPWRAPFPVRPGEPHERAGRFVPPPDAFTRSDGPVRTGFEAREQANRTIRRGAWVLPPENVLHIEVLEPERALPRLSRSPTCRRCPPRKRTAAPSGAGRTDQL